MTRRSRMLGVVLVAAVAALGALSSWRIERDRSELIAWFAAQREAQLADAVAVVEDDLGDIAEDLALTAELLEGAESDRERERILRTLLGSVRPYAAASLADANGWRVRVEDRRATPVPADWERLVGDVVARAASRSAGEVDVSPQLPAGEDLWYRAFATPTSEGGALVLLVDMGHVLEALELAATGTQGLLVLGPHGRASSVSTPGLEAAREAPALAPAFASLGAGGGGTMRLDERAAAALGLPTADAVVAWRAIDMPGGGRWMALTFASTDAIRVHERALVLRIAAGAFGAMLIVGLFALLQLRSFRERAVLEERLRHAADTAELHNRWIGAEKLATVGVLAAGVAHEIGTPLAVVRGRAEQALSRLGPGHAQARHLGVILDQIDQISRSIRALLDFSRQSPSTKEAVDALAVAGGTIDLLRYEASRRGLRLRVIGEPCVVVADPDRLRQVLINLLVNAMDASAPGTEVRIRLTAGAAVGTIAVEDEGTGIAPEHLSRVRDAFFTTKEPGRGTGLGLAIADAIVRDHGGALALESAPGVGTRAILSWPAPSRVEVARAS